MSLDLDRVSDAAITGAALRQLAPLGALRAVPGGAQLACEGAAVEALYLVGSGRFLHTLPVDGLGPDADEVPVAESLRGALIGLGDWAADGRHAASVRAVAAGEVIVLDPRRVMAAAHDDPALALLLIGLMSTGLRRCIAEAGRQRRATVTQRTAGYLLDLPRLGRGARHEVRLPMPKKTLAAHLGVTQQSLSRVLRRLRDVGVQVDGRRVLIADPVRLRAVAGWEEA